MSAALRNVVIIGGGGRIGAIVLRGLLAAPSFNITALKRPESKSTFPKAANLDVVTSDFSNDSLVSIFKGKDAVISVVGGFGFGDQKAYIDAAVQAGVKRFFPSEFGINGQSETVRKLTPFFAVKQEVLDYLIEKESEGLTWSCLITGPIVDWCLAIGFLGFDISTKRALIWDDGNTMLSGLSEASLGSSVLAALEKPEQTANRFLYVSSLATTQNEMLQALERATGSQWTVSHTTTKEQFDAAQEKLGKGDFSGGFTIVKGTSLGNMPGLNQHFEQDEKARLANELLGVKKESIQDLVDAVVARGNYDGSEYF